MKRSLQTAVATVLLALSLVACGGEEPAPVAEPSSNGGYLPDADTGEMVPVTDDQMAGQVLAMSVHGDPDLFGTYAAFDDAQIIELGHLVCQSFDQGEEYLPITFGLVSASGGRASAMDSSAFVGASVGAMCDEYSGMIG